MRSQVRGQGAARVTLSPEWLQDAVLAGEKVERYIKLREQNTGALEALGAIVASADAIEQALRVGIQCMIWLSEIAEDRRLYVSTRMMAAAMRPPRRADWKAITQLLVDNGLLSPDTPAEVIAADHHVVQCEGCRLSLPLEDKLHTCTEKAA